MNRDNSDDFFKKKFVSLMMHKCTKINMVLLLQLILFYNIRR